jgi:zinc D-Ala-D-Ala carboxypeptidase
VLMVEVEHLTERAQAEEEEHQRQLAIADAARGDAASLHAQVAALTDETSRQLDRSTQLVAALGSEQLDVEARIVNLEAQVAAELEERTRREREARQAAERERLDREAAERAAAASAPPVPTPLVTAQPAPSPPTSAPSGPVTSAPAQSAAATGGPAPSAPASSAPSSAPAAAAPGPSAPATSARPSAPSAAPVDTGAAERDRQAQAERDRQAQAERDRQAQAERDRQAQAERDRQAQAERDRQAQAERDRQAQAERDRQAQAERAAASASVGPGPNPSLRTVGGITVAASLAPNLQALLDHARRDGIVLGGSGYRSPEITARLRLANGCPDVYNSPPSACRVPTAIPGSSEHEKGLAVDFTYQGQTICFPLRSSSCTGNQAFDWLRRNASTYGFYNLPSEAWHWSTTGR